MTEDFGKLLKEIRETVARMELELAKSNPEGINQYTKGGGKAGAEDEKLKAYGHDPKAMRQAVANQHAIENEAPHVMEERHTKERESLESKHVREQNDKSDHGPLGEKEVQKYQRQANEVKQMASRHALERRMAANKRQASNT